MAMGTLGAIKSQVNALLKPVGQAIAGNDVVPDFRRLVRHLDNKQLRPRTVFDIGVAYVTEILYEAWPGAHFYLIDPTPQSLPHMEQIARRLSATVLNVGLGARSETRPMNVREIHSDSSLFEEVGHADVVKIDVPIRRFDEVVSRFERPAFAKIDVQGAEIGVIEGFGSSLNDIDVLMIETSLIATVHDGPEFFDVCRILHDRGFVLFDIVGSTRRPLDKALAQIDAIFVPVASPLRQDKRWND